MELIEYIGIKPNGRKDTVAGTGIEWTHKGDVREVPEHAVPLLLKHTDIWARAKAPAGLSEAPPPDAPPPAEPGPYELQGADGQIVDLAKMDDAELKAFVRGTPGLDAVDLRKKGDALRDAIMELIRAQA